MQGQLYDRDKLIWELPFTQLTGDDVLPFLKIPRFSFEVNLSRISFSSHGHPRGSPHSQSSCPDILSTELLSQSRVVSFNHGYIILRVFWSRGALLGDGNLLVGFISVCFGSSSGPFFIRMTLSGWSSLHVATVCFGHWIAFDLARETPFMTQLERCLFQYSAQAKPDKWMSRNTLYHFAMCSTLV